MSDPRQAQDSASTGSASKEAGSASKEGHSSRQAILYCPYCAEETLFPLEGGGWECRSCLRAFSVTFLGLATPGPRLERESS
jgi:ribosomal protein L37AE/L43A